MRSSLLFLLATLLMAAAVTAGCGRNGSTDGDGTDGDTLVDGDGEPIPEGLPPPPAVRPSLAALPSHRDPIIARIDSEPWATLYQRIRDRAGRAHYDFPVPDTFDSGEQQNGDTALACAFIAWIEQDEAMAAKAREFMALLSDNYASHQDFDINIRLPSIVMGYAFALDLLLGADMMPPAEAAEIERKLTAIIGAFHDEYVLDDVVRTMSIFPTQNNHPIRTACSIGTIALAFPDHPRAREWADWAFSELDYLWGPVGRYVTADGGVSEGSLYYRFAFGPSLALALAWEQRSGGRRLFSQNCINRQERPPWTGHGCVDGAPFVWEGLLSGERFRQSVDWWFSLRMPSGERPPLEDSSPKRGNGGAIMAGFMGRPDLVWDWLNDDLNTGGGFDLEIQHLALVPDFDDPGPPAWRHRVMPEAGQAVFRSGWGPDDIWLLLTAEHGQARMTVHDHVDGGSFTLAAYGEYLLIDTGYHKPIKSDNARTAHAAAHNLLSIEGEPVPPKGLLWNFGDADAFLENDHLGADLAYVEARQPLERSVTERAVALVRDRYAVIFDRVVTPVTTARRHTWRLHGLAGYSEGGEFVIEGGQARWQREKAGVELHLASTAAGLVLVEPPFVEETAPHVHRFEGPAAHHGVADGVVEAVTPLFVAIAAPYRTGAADGAADGRLAVEQLSAPAGVAGFVVTHAGNRDLFLARALDAAESFDLPGIGPVETDSAWIVATLSGPEPIFLLARGSFLSINGSPVFENVTGPVTVKEGR